MNGDHKKKGMDDLKDLGRDSFLLSSISNAIDSLVVVLDEEGRIIWYNKTCEGITGLPLAEAKKEYYWSIFSPPQEQEICKEFFLSLEPGDFPCEVETYHQKGEKCTLIVWRHTLLQNSHHGIRYYVMTGTDLTLRRESQQIIQEMGEQYRALIHASPVAFISLDTNGVITSWSAAAEQIFGWSEKEVQGQPMTHFFGESQETIQEYIQMALGRRSFNHLEFSCSDRGHTLIHLDVSLAPIYNYRGEVSSVVMVIKDITERKKAQQRLQQQLEFQKMAAAISKRLVNISLDELDQGIHQVLRWSGEYFSIDHSFLLWLSNGEMNGYVNHHWTAEGIRPLANFSPAHLIQGEDPLYIGDVDELPPSQEAVKGSFKEQGIQSLLLIPMVDRDTLKGVLGYAAVVPLALTEEEISFLQVVAQIISGVFTRLQFQKALQRSEGYNRSIVELIPDRIVRFNSEGVFLDVIRSSQGDLFLKKEDLLGRRIFDVLPKDEAYSFFQAIKRAIQTSSLQLVDYALKSPTVNIWFEARIIPSGNQEVMALIRNVTEQKMGEHRIKGYNRQLKLQQQELEELYRQLDEEVNKAISIHEAGLPREFPLVAGISIAAYYRPAQKLGGDFFYVMKKGKRLVIYLSDVTGHGLDGAILSVFVKNTINSYLAMTREEQITPEAMIQFLTEQYQKESYPNEYFLSIYLAVVDLETFSLHYLGAGFQDYPLMARRDAQSLELINTGLPISPVIPQDLLNAESKEILLKEGTTLLFNTDGLTEQLVGREEYGSQLKEVFYKNASFPPEVIVHAINQDFLDFNSGSDQGDDDITFLILQVDSSSKKKYRLQLKSHFQELESLRNKILAVLPESKEREWFLVGLHELVANAMEHGNQFHPKKTVNVELQITEEYFFAAIADEGKGFNWQERIQSPLEMEGKEERGRGLPLTGVFSHLFFYNEEGNTAYLLVNCHL